MASTYSIVGHPLLSEDVTELDAAVQLAHAEVAERLLGLSGTHLSGQDAIDASNAVAMQVNYQVAFPPETWAVKSEARGAISVTYRGEGEMPPIAPMALRIIDGLAAVLGISSSRGWAPFGGRR